jgi:hypothetical protein
MGNTLMQNSGLLIRKRFEITEHGLAVIQKRIFKSHEYFLRFENIGLMRLKSKSNNKGWIIASLGFISLSIFLFIQERQGVDVEKDAFVFYSIVAALCLLISILTHKRIFYLAKNDKTNAIEFITDNPSKSEVEEFILTLSQTRNSYLIKIYGQGDRNLDYTQQHNQLLWLLENDALSPQDFQQKSAELKAMFTIPNQVLGFDLHDN